MNGRELRRRLWMIPTTLVLASGFVLAQAPPAAAPAGAAPKLGGTIEDANGYKVLVSYGSTLKDPKEARKRETDIRNTTRQIATGELAFADNRTTFERYYRFIFFPGLTQTDQESLSNLPVERQRFFQQHVDACRDPAVRDVLCNLALQQATAIVRDNFHPAVRYNAMLLISSLNDKDAVRIGADKATPEPMAAALPIILDEFTKAENSDAVRMAALLGILRHLEWDPYRVSGPAIAAPVRARISKSLLDLATQQEPPKTRTAEGHDWLRRRAIEGLVLLGNSKVDADTAAALDTLLKDEKESLAVRCAAAAAIGRVVYTAPVKLDPTPVAKELGYLALLSCDKELTRITELKKHEADKAARLSSAASGMSAMGGMGGAGDGYDPASAGGGYDPASAGGGYPGGSSPGGTYPGGSSPGGTYPGGSGDMYGGGGDMYGGGGMSGGMYGSAKPVDPKQYRFDYVRRRIRANLFAVQIGLLGPNFTERPASGDAAAQGPVRGVENLAKAEPDKAYVAKVKSALEQLIKTVEVADSDLETLEKDLRKEMKPLEAITRKLAAAAPPAATADVPAIPDAVPSAPAKSRPAAAPESPAEDAPPAPAPPPAGAAPPSPTPMPMPMPTAPAPAAGAGARG